jgi:hypothetical protein
MKTQSTTLTGTAKSNRLWPAPALGPENMLLVLVSNRALLTCFRSLTGISNRTP